MKKNYMLGVVVASFALGANPLQGQEEARRAGFWISLGAGAGVSTAEPAANESHWGGAGYIRAGGVPDQQVVLGTELIGWVTGQNDVYTTRGVWTFFAQYYPSKTGGLFFKGGLGAAGLAVTTDLDPGTFVTSTDGFGMTLGTGYELRLSSVASITLNGDWVLQIIDDQAGGSVNSSLFLFTVGFTFPKIG